MPATRIVQARRKLVKENLFMQAGLTGDAEGVENRAAAFAFHI